MEKLLGNLHYNCPINSKLEHISMMNTIQKAKQLYNHYQKICVSILCTVSLNDTDIQPINIL